MALENSLKMRWSRGEKVERLHPKMSNTDNCEEKKKKKKKLRSLCSPVLPRVVLGYVHFRVALRLDERLNSSLKELSAEAAV